MNSIDPRIEVVLGDITTLSVGAVVNAANSSLLGGGGVDGAIHRRAGRELGVHCAQLGGCRVGDAKITPGFGLPAPYIIHTVGPVWQGGTKGEAALLAACYRNALQLADEHRLSTIAFPAISTGRYGYPVEEAARVAVDIVVDFLKPNRDLQQVIFCCFTSETADAHRQALIARASDG